MTAPAVVQIFTCQRCGEQQRTEAEHPYIVQDFGDTGWSTIGTRDSLGSPVALLCRPCRARWGEVYAEAVRRFLAPEKSEP